MDNDVNDVPFNTNNVLAWAINRYGPNIARKVKLWSDPGRGLEGKCSFQLNLAEMQRIYIQTLHAKLATHAKSFIDGTEPDPEGNWHGDLHNYVQALQDHDYMAQCSKFSRDPFIVSGERAFDREILTVVMRDISWTRDEENARAGAPATTALPNTDEEKSVAETPGTTVLLNICQETCKERSKEKARDKLYSDRRIIDVWSWEEGDDGIPIVPPRSDIRHNDLYSRIVAATVGAGFLIGPMWLMMVKTGFYTALIATTVFIIAFGVMVAVVLEKSNDVFAATLAYAAVLVVLVGLVRSPS